MTLLARLTLLSLATGGLLAGCGSYTSSCGVPDATVVTLEAGVDGLPEIGKSCSPALSKEFCGNAYLHCVRTKPLTINCAPGCL